MRADAESESEGKAVRDSESDDIGVCETAGLIDALREASKLAEEVEDELMVREKPALALAVPDGAGVIDPVPEAAAEKEAQIDAVAETVADAVDDTVLAPVLSADALLMKVGLLESDALDDIEGEPEVEADRTADCDTSEEIEGSGLADNDALGLRVCVSEAVILAVTHADGDLAPEEVIDSEPRSDTDSCAEREAIDVVDEAVRLGAIVLEAEVHRLKVAEVDRDDDTVGLAEREESCDRLERIDGEDEDEGQELREEEKVGFGDVVGEFDEREDVDVSGDGVVDIDDCGDCEEDAHSEVDASVDAVADALEHWDCVIEGPGEVDAATFEKVALGD